MTDYGNNNQKQAPYAYANVPPRGNETALMIEGLYNGLTYDLQKMKKELMNELKYAAMQSSSVYQSRDCFRYGDERSNRAIHGSRTEIRLSAEPNDL